MEYDRQEMTPELRERWKRQIEAAQADRSESDEYFRMAEPAAAEATFSGELRRAIHAVHARQMLLPTLLERAGVDWKTLRPFMTGEASLPTEVVDRLVAVLGLHLQEVPTIAGSTGHEESGVATP